MNKAPNKQKIAFAALAFLVLLSGVAPAQWAQDGVSAADEKVHIVAPLTLLDLTGTSRMELRLPMMPGQYSSVIAPLIAFHYGFGNLSVGVSMPMSVVQFAQADAQVDAGNPTLDFRGRHCFQWGWSVCFGGGISMAFGFQEWDTDVFDLYDVVVGGFALQDWGQFMRESISLRTLAAATATNGTIFAQFELGEQSIIPLEAGSSADYILYQFALGARLGKLVPALEFKGMTLISGNASDIDFDQKSLVWLNLGLRLIFDGLTPMVRLTIPLTELSEAGSKLHVELGFSIPL